jgi:hypothetical protein
VVGALGRGNFVMHPSVELLPRVESISFHLTPHDAAANDICRPFPEICMPELLIGGGAPRSILNIDYDCLLETPRSIEFNRVSGLCAFHGLREISEWTDRKRVCREVVGVRHDGHE